MKHVDIGSDAVLEDTAENYLLRPCGILSDSDKPVKSGEGGKDDC